MLLIISSKEIDTAQPFYTYLSSLNKILLTLPVEEVITELLTTEKIDAVIGFEHDLELIKSTIVRFPMLNYALLSRATAEDFHEMTEGYGFFYQLPETPGLDHGQELMAILEKISISVADQQHSEQIK